MRLCCPQHTSCHAARQPVGVQRTRRVNRPKSNQFIVCVPKAHLPRNVNIIRYLFPQLHIASVSPCTAAPSPTSPTAPVTINDTNVIQHIVLEGTLWKPMEH
eukprot:gene4282-biopygen7747